MMHRIGRLFMKWTKIKGWLSDVKIISPILLLLYSGTLVALDSRYLTLTSYADGVRQSIQREISVLEIKLGFAVTEKDKQILRALIAVKRQQLKEVK